MYEASLESIIMNKCLILISLSIVLLTATSPVEVHAQSKNLKAGYYLTIAAYSKSKEHYAKSYTEKVNKMGYEAAYSFFPKKNYYFVYLKYYNDFNTSIRDLYQTRKSTDFGDCWVYVMRQSEVIEKALNKEVNSLNDMFAERFKDTSSEDAENQSELDTVAVSSNKKEQLELSAEEKTDSTLVDKPSETSSKEIKEKDASKNVYLSLFYGRTGKEVQGQVQVIDASNHTLIKKYDGNKVITIKDPENGNGDLIIISEVFGYKKVQHDFNYSNPFDDEEYPYVTNIEDTIIVNFELSRYSKGDIITMYNVFFFKDAAIMRPQSKYEINELVAMLKENSQMKIRIHGHTNGSTPGKIISMKEGNTNFFSLSDDNKISIGSSKKLSLERALIMKNYLVDQGINSKNIDTKAWGGKAKIHNKLSSQAHKNIRVEIEVVED